VGDPAAPAGHHAYAVAMGVLRHPLTLLIVGAAISALIVPMFTQRWQDHQRALDVQTALVSDMTKAGAAYEQDVDYTHFRLGKSSGATNHAYWIRKLDALQRGWEIKREVIRARLLAYYGEGSVSAAWDRLTGADLWLYSAAAGGSSARVASPFMSHLIGKKVDLTEEEGWVNAMVSVAKLRDKAVKSVLDTTPSV
jgi:hypothetical protein